MDEARAPSMQLIKNRKDIFRCEKTQKAIKSLFVSAIIIE